MSRRTRHRIRTPLALYRPGDSWLHRITTGGKLLALAAAGTAVFASGSGAVSAGVLAGTLAVLLAIGIPPSELWRQGRPVLFLVAVLTAFQIVIGRPEEGVMAALRLLAVAAVAIAVTMTTSITQMVDWIEQTLLRLRVRRARVFRIGLAFGLALRSVDHLAVVAQQVLDARRARGLQRSMRAFAVPTVVAAARFAHGVGEALEARGIADADPALRDE